MRIALVTETFPPEVNGVGRTLLRLSIGLRDKGHELEVVRPTHLEEDGSTPAPVPQWVVPGAPLPGYPRLRFGFYCRRRLLKRWRQRTPDVIHVATEGPLGLAAQSAARKLRIPVASSFHTNFHAYGEFYGYGLLTGVALSYLRLFHNRADCTLVPSRETVDKLHRYGFRRLGLLTRGVDTALFDPGRRSTALRRSWGAAQEDPVVLYVGRLAKEKNLELAIQVFDDLKECQPRARCVLVGDGPLETVIANRHPDVRMSGLKRGEELAAHYASGDILIFPSLTETFGNVVLEGMASGLAVVAFDYAAAGEHITNGVDGVTVRRGDGLELGRQTMSLASSPARWREMGMAARSTAESLTWEAVVDSWESRLRELTCLLSTDEPLPTFRSAAKLDYSKTQSS
jgi:glycosyltransferase involved in cell wall biosynthesis